MYLIHSLFVLNSVCYAKLLQNHFYRLSPTRRSKFFNIRACSGNICIEHLLFFAITFRKFYIFAKINGCCISKQ